MRNFETSAKVVGVCSKCGWDLFDGLTHSCPTANKPESKFWQSSDRTNSDFNDTLNKAIKISQRGFV